MFSKAELIDIFIEDYWSRNWRTPPVQREDGSIKYLVKTEEYKDYFYKNRNTFFEPCLNEIMYCADENGYNMDEAIESVFDSMYDFDDTIVKLDKCFFSEILSKKDPTMASLLSFMAESTQYSSEHFWDTSCNIMQTVLSPKNSIIFCDKDFLNKDGFIDLLLDFLDDHIHFGCTVRHFQPYTHVIIIFGDENEWYADAPPSENTIIPISMEGK